MNTEVGQRVEPKYCERNKKRKVTTKVRKQGKRKEGKKEDELRESEGRRKEGMKEKGRSRE